MTIEQMKAEHRAKVKEARGLYRKITDDTTDAEARKIEAQFNAAMLDVDELRDKIEEAEERAAENLPDPRRPNMDGAARGVDGPEPQIEVKAAGLRPDQRMGDHIRREHPDDAETYGELEIGRLMRAMVTGAKTDLERRALAEGSDSAGGFTVPTVTASQLIDLMRARSVAVRAGATTIPLESDQTVIAKLASDPVPAWRSENAGITVSDPTFSAVTLAPKSLAVLVKVSRELIEDSVNLAVELPRILAAAMAEEWDRVALLGSGSAPEPEGIANVSGINTAALSGALSNYAPLVTARTSLLSANHTPSAIIAHPRDEGTLAGLTASDGQPLMAPRQISDVPMLTTTAIPTDGGAGSDESTIFMGDFSRLILGVRSDIRVEIVRELFAGDHQLAFIAHMRGDIAVSHAEAFHTTTAVQG
jgi:HK97 family phage major capsid protein